MKKKQIVGYSILICLSIVFVLSCLFLPLFHTKLCDYNYGDVLVDGNFSFLEFIKQDLFNTNTNLFDAYFYASGPVWLTLSMIYLNVLTLIGSVFLFVLSIIGLIFAIRKQNFSFKNSAIYKTGNFVGGFAILATIAQVVGFIVLTSLGNGYVAFSALIGCYINAVIGVGIVVASYLVKDKEASLKENKTRDSIFFLLTSVVSVVLGVMLVTLAQISKLLVPEDLSTILGFNKLALEIGSNPVGAEYPLGFALYGLIVVLIGLAFVAIYSIIGFIRALKGKSINWLSVRVKRWSKAVLDVFSLLFILIMCCGIILGVNIILTLPEQIVSTFNWWVYVEFAMPFILVITTRFIGVYGTSAEQ